MTHNDNLIDGFRFSAVAAGIKRADSSRLDLALIATDCPASTAGVTTTNLVYAPPVAVTRRRLEGGLCSAVLMNSGNANAYTRERGLEDAVRLTGAVAAHLRVDPEHIIPMSTGVIGNPLPVDRMMTRIPDLVEALEPAALDDVARAIMTTDTVPKTAVRTGAVSSGPVKLIGVAKGSGMIAPNMATMLAVVMSDMRADAGFLKEALVNASATSFNAITVDGDMSTNDTLLIMSGGHPDARTLLHRSEDEVTFASLLSDVCLDLAEQLVRDGEGATKVVDVRVIGAPDSRAAIQVARTIAESLLVKTAFHGEDPNWGRIICTAGRAGIPFDPDRVELLIGDVPVVRDGLLVEDDWESKAHAVMKRSEYSVTVDLKNGDGQGHILTTDLSREYVSINADYRS